MGKKARALFAVSLGLWAVAGILSPAQATVLSGHTRVVAAPFEGHPGDPIYISGSGFPARANLIVVMACPNLRRPVQALFGYNHIRSDAHGQFVGVRIFVPAPRQKLSATGLRCAVYTAAQQGALSRTVPAPFLILPRGQRLARCATTICLRVTASLVRLRSGTQGTIVINGWPGATARIVVFRPTGSNLVRQLRLDWNGVGSARLLVSLGLKKGVREQAAVTARLGRFTGSGSTSFSVVPLGR